MNFLSVENLSFSLGERTLFQNLSFGIQKGEKIALVAPNGTGKSTLFRILSGKENKTSGQVIFRRGITTGYLDQDPVIDSDLSIGNYIKQWPSVTAALLKKFEQLSEKSQTDYSAEILDEMQQVSEEIEQHDGWNYERRLETIMEKLESNHPDLKISQLSGGQKKRLALSLILVDKPDILLLDEPTNHLDIEMTEWLEQYLSEPGITLFMVTHDRYFLDRVCTHILEMEDEKLYLHKGNYEYYLEKKTQREEVEGAEIHKAQRLMLKELEWLRKQPRARTTKSKSRIAAFDSIEEKAGSGKKKQELSLGITMQRLGNKILEIKSLSKSFGSNTLIKNFSFAFQRGARIGITGKNGTGKTTLLNIISGKENPDAGTIETGETLNIGYFTQKNTLFKEEKRTIDVIKDIGEYLEIGGGKKLSASQLLEHFLFSPSSQYAPVSKLSGGEKRRLQLVCILMKNPNFLILDEPTNDLDLLTLQKLEEFLLEFQGCLVLVSHDRYFMDRLTNSLIVFEGDAVISTSPLSWSAYREKKKAENALKPEKETQKPPAPEANATDRKTQKLSYKEKLELEAINSEMEKIEVEKSKLETLMQGGETDPEAGVFEKYSVLNERLEKITQRWFELSEKTQA
jgi:ABC transport system ATP-binding/permease protein